MPNPSGASTGIHEALELRDKLDTYMGKSVFKAVENVASAGQKLVGKDERLQFDIDQFLLDLDGTDNKVI